MSSLGESARARRTVDARAELELPRLGDDVRSRQPCSRDSASANTAIAIAVAVAVAIAAAVAVAIRREESVAADEPARVRIERVSGQHVVEGNGHRPCSSAQAVAAA